MISYRQADIFKRIKEKSAPATLSIDYNTVGINFIFCNVSNDYMLKITYLLTEDFKISLIKKDVGQGCIRYTHEWPVTMNGDIKAAKAKEILNFLKARTSHFVKHGPGIFRFKIDDAFMNML